MLAILTKNGKIVQGTGISFAVVGTTMHILNVASMVPSPVSHTWSTLAIAGFFLTSSSQIGRSTLFKGLVKKGKKSQVSRTHKNDVALP
ncbi:hypothetical protein [Nitrososphaera sp.]|uniref:hypothetical protein n=1 Tax=Nitrososphaera sp. TaxID=1971748 RepID=UPI00307FA667